jgi:hypothetical protein
MHRRTWAHGSRVLRERSPCRRRLATTRRTQAATGIRGFVRHDFEAYAVMTLAQLHQQFINDFFSAIEPLHRENKNPSSFGYLAVKHGEEFYLVQGALILNAAPRGSARKLS